MRDAKYDGDWHELLLRLKKHGLLEEPAERDASDDGDERDDDSEPDDGKEFSNV